ncbi:MAG: NAD-dependent epimerase/dehydratase family protein [Dehalococcoidia bacterium]|nr:NAD-dependent epimerase/dehydratase family protein [Dehalococcoidia bacterium]
MKTVVTGASGHIGVNLVRALLSKGRDIRVFSHNSNLGLEDLPVEFFKGDICDIDSMERAFQGAEFVYHLAGRVSLLHGDWQRCSDINVEGTRNVIKACQRTKVQRLVHFSSIHAFRSDTCAVINESQQLVESMKSPSYDRSKAAGEKLVRQAVKEGLDAVIINPTAVIGPYDYRPSHQGQALIMMASGKLPVLLNGGFDWVDVRDIVEYAIKAQETAHVGASYLLSGHWLSVKEMAQMAAEVTGIRPPWITCPMGLAEFCAPIVTVTSQMLKIRPLFTRTSLIALKSNSNVNYSKATKELGYNPRPIRETIVDTIQWFQENGYLNIQQKVTGI